MQTENVSLKKLKKIIQLESKSNNRLDKTTKGFGDESPQKIKLYIQYNFRHCTYKDLMGFECTYNVLACYF